MSRRCERCVLFVAALSLCVAAAAAASRRFPTLEHLKSRADDKTQGAAVAELLRRLLGTRSAEFVVVVDGSLSDDSLDVCELRSTKNNKIVATGNTGVSVASGIYNYLKYFCNCHVSWSGDQVALPRPLPRLSGVLRINTQHRFRYYQNVCTASYSSVWWDWPRWEREIDWMALNGINLPLAFTGQEALWQEVYRALGLNQSEIEEFFAGPAFLAWNRMGNLFEFGGPLPQSWHVNQLTLQFNILERMRSFGMIPVLPAFSGNIPRGILRLHPEANVTRLGPWAHFNCSYSCSYILDPRDPLFLRIGSLYLSQVIKQFGTNHIYNTDTFNEMVPPSSDPAYLSAVSRSVFASMTAVDPQAIWLMQGWLFFSAASFWKPAQIQALLHGVPLGRMIVLDLFAETEAIFSYTESFYGQPFIWCVLQNFGGNSGLFGTVESINSGPFKASHFPNSTMVGVGMSPEGIEQNPVMYELMSELAWRKEPVNLVKWASLYAVRRYGTTRDSLITAWRLLFSSVYNCTVPHYRNHNHSPLVRRPSLRMNTDLWYNPANLFKAWKLLIEASPSLMSEETFRYDLVDVTREVLQVLTTSFYLDITDAFHKQKLPELLISAGVLIYDLLPELDRLLCSDRHFLLGKWLERAQSLAIDEEEAKLYDMNARNQLTLWGPSGEIQDYASKEWGGLMEDYYAQRWGLFVQTLVWCLDSGQPFKQDAFNQAVFQVEKGFIYNGRKYPTKPQGDTYEITRRIFLKYYPQALKTLKRLS
ncbi:alpha-N-acetylglucosaminidase isoform X1 [Phycodurus eques]|uniref:alpha-N-acetylglucosaminidase isoform X1 n=1 Tax=Phycodurus eques TaxID=693459 RepID=UPI002ACE34D1|nr:alpha-N-acetylglucosaminidase isoform X1 [Phycodurus eques]